MDEIRKLYKENEDFKAYVDRYAKNRQIESEKALEHEIVRQVAKYYTEKR